MRQIKVVIEGLPPGLLINNPAGMLAPKKLTQRGKIPTREEDAEKSAYRLVPGDLASELVLPARCLHRSLMKMSSAYSTRKNPISSRIISALHIEPELIPLGTNQYTIDSQSAVIQKARIVRSRALVIPWAGEFELWWDEEWLALDFMRDSMPKIIRDAGRLNSVLDFPAGEERAVWHLS